MKERTLTITNVVEVKTGAPAKDVARAVSRHKGEQLWVLACGYVTVLESRTIVNVVKEKKPKTAKRKSKR